MGCDVQAAERVAIGFTHPVQKTTPGLPAE
jgi:hypothetical protein